MRDTGKGRTQARALMIGSMHCWQEDDKARMRDLYRTEFPKQRSWKKGFSA